MAITKPVIKDTNKSADDFIGGAPDADKPARKGVMKGKKEQVTLTIAPDLLAKVDGVAVEMGQSRAAVINMAIFRFLQTGI